MYQNPNYMLITIDNTPYLQPFGQAIADFGKSVQINKTGVFLWNQLKEDLTKEALLQRMIDHYEIAPLDYPSVKIDLENFLNPLLSTGIIQEKTCLLKKDIIHEHVYKLISIGELSVLLCGDPVYYSENFDPFEVKQSFKSSAELSVFQSGNLIKYTDDKDEKDPKDTEDDKDDNENIHNIRTSSEYLCNRDFKVSSLNKSTSHEVIESDKCMFDLVVSVHKYKILPKGNGKILLQTKDLWLIEQSDCYQFIFPSMSQLYWTEINKAGTEAHIYITAGSDSFSGTDSFVFTAPLFENKGKNHPSQKTRESLSDEANDSIKSIDDEKACKEDIFHIIRFLYLYTAQKHEIYAIHSASLLYQDQAWLFSGHSGIGKSTHTNLWHTYFETPLINGDLNLITLKDGKPLVYGLPWCGTSGISSTKTYLLGGIIFLKQSPKNLMDELTCEEQILRITQRLISPTWKPEQMQQCISFAEKLTKKIYAAQLRCTKERDAALFCKKKIDEYLFS